MTALLLENVKLLVGTGLSGASSVVGDVVVEGDTGSSGSGEDSGRLSGKGRGIYHAVM